MKNQFKTNFGRPIIVKNEEMQLQKYSRKFEALRIWSHLLKRFLMENFIFCVVLPKWLAVALLFM